MWYRWLANFVVLVHFGFVLFVALGGFAVLRRHRLAWVHAPAAVWGVVIEYTGWTCPLTPLELALRRLGGNAGYRSGFIEHYVTALMYPEGLSRGAQVLLGSLVLVFNVGVYATLYVRWRRSRKQSRAGTTPSCEDEGKRHGT
jgi:hypothetical protein